ncbi:family 43 glycosylhydrolase (plasmid) [Rathayibacter sp. VKM Ac-2803]|uniref:family 43 glycosylhydrolase n=1 Tax=Rathayibacter sp. VKM Ac-2803 TaxID=2609256 RepID=UPI0013574DCC|nr:family 43 glycosylhydrolase [Rathayibacter sp. VKM Ac-2803]MWV51371.1 family 43 glycosylhydrolase [Rathayibacter sp. VKM Ac-2803]
MRIFTRPRVIALIALGLAAAIFALSMGFGPRSQRPDPQPPSASATFSPAEATTSARTPPNGTLFVDTAGAPIHAHGGGMLEHDGVFYWVGENRNESNRFESVSLYSSPDLANWTFQHDILTQASAPDLVGATIERPKLLFNEPTDSFVLWMHWENGVDYNQARTAVAVSPMIDGDYVYKRSFRPLGYESRDQTVFQAEDGSAYLASATSSNADLNIYRLSDDFTEPVALLTTLWPGAYREAPALFQRNDTYFLMTSGATGWDPNQAMYATAPDPAGPWSELLPVGDAEAFGSQAAFVLPVAGSSRTSFLYLGDRWAGARDAPVNDSDYVWLPLTFPTERSLSLEWSTALSISVSEGTIDGVAPGTPFREFHTATDDRCLDAPGLEGDATAIIYDCNGGANQQWQTIPVSDEEILVRSRTEGTCITVRGQLLVLETCSGSAEQMLSLVPEGPKSQRLAFEESCLTEGDERSAVLDACSRQLLFDPTS